MRKWEERCVEDIVSGIVQWGMRVGEVFVTKICLEHKIISHLISCTNYSRNRRVAAPL